MSSIFKPSTGGGSSDPTTMDDVTATRLGYKTYYHGTTYAGGNAPTFAGPSITSVIRGWVRPFQDQAGNWWIDFGVRTTVSAGASLSFTLAGVTFLSVTDYQQGLTLSQQTNTSAAKVFCHASPATNTVDIQLTAAVADISVSGTVQIDAAPDFAYT